MFISHSHRFIFVHTYKVAGSSIREALAPYGIDGESYNIAHHATAEQIREQIPDLFEEYFTFAFVRNPWDFEVSIYHYGVVEKDKATIKPPYYEGMSFEEFLSIRLQRRTSRGAQVKFLVDEEGNRIVDFVGKIENIEEDFKKVCEHIGIQASLPHVNTTMRHPYQQYYNPGTIELVQKMSQPEIKLFGYSFDESPKGAFLL